MPVTIPLMPHQQLAKDFILTHPFCGVWMGIGSAKSRTALSALAGIRPSGHILVIAPLAIARSTWLGEIAKWGFNVRIRSLVVDERDRKLTRVQRKQIYSEFFDSAPTMYFINQELVDDLVDSMPIVGEGVDRARLWPFPTVIIDEAQEFKNPTSVRFTALVQVRSAITRLIELTGTPSPQSLLDIWSQIFLLDGGLALGDVFLDYREKYFTIDKLVNGRPVSWKLRPGAEEAIHAKIGHLVMSAVNTGLKLPPIAFSQVPCSLPEDVQTAYAEFRRENVIELATPDPDDPDTMIITADNAAILQGKLLQFASGTLYTGDNHDVEFAQVHDRKLHALLDIVSHQNGEPLMVAFRYRSDRRLIPEFLAEHGYQTEVLDGSRGMIERWNAKQIPVMMLQPASFRHGLNLQGGGCDLVWYTIPDSLEHWDQTNGRLYRLGQVNPVRVVSLIAEGTVDARQPARLTRKAMTQDALVRSVLLECKDDLRDLALARQAA